MLKLFKPKRFYVTPPNQQQFAFEASFSSMLSNRLRTLGLLWNKKNSTNEHKLVGIVMQKLTKSICNVGEIIYFRRFFFFTLIHLLYSFQYSAI